MARLRNARDGVRTRVKDHEVEFSYFPTTKGVASRAGLQVKTYTTDAWSVVTAAVRQVSSKSNRKSAIAFSEQAYEFYQAAEASSTVRAKPLLLYYCFLNLTKALCLTKGNDSIIGPAYHGLQETKNSEKKLVSAKVIVKKNKGQISVFEQFCNEVIGAAPSPGDQYRVRDLIGCSLIGHRLWCDAVNRSDCFFRVDPIEMIHSKEKKQIWLRAFIERGTITRADLKASDVTKMGFGEGWDLVKTPAEKSESLFCWEQSEVFDYSRTPAERLDEIAAVAKATFYRSLTVSEPFRNYYVYSRPERFKKYHQMASRYVLLFFLGSVTRYHPADFDSYMDDDLGPFLSEFLASEPSQMLFEFASYFANREVISVGLA